MDRKIRRGQIYLANLEPIIGSEQGGIRPVLIIQNNKGNKHSGTTIVAPITTRRIPNRLPVHVYTFAGSSGLPQNSSVMLEQIRVLDKSRLTDYVGRINDFTMDEVDRALKISVGLNSNKFYLCWNFLDKLLGENLITEAQRRKIESAVIKRLSDV